MLFSRLFISTSLLAPALANFGAIVGETLDKRGFLIGGGWGLIVADENGCPAGTNSHNDNGDWVCCPNGFPPQDSAGPESRACCNEGTDFS
jgi:hypothetical protein